MNVEAPISLTVLTYSLLVPLRLILKITKPICYVTTLHAANYNTFDVVKEMKLGVT